MPHQEKSYLAKETNNTRYEQDIWDAHAPRTFLNKVLELSG
jgi:hypothetical protein